MNKIKTVFWQVMAALVTTQVIKKLLIRAAIKKPYSHIGDYMGRYWLVKKSWLPFSIRIHYIARPDAEAFLHDHPFNWRTIILDGWYIEEIASGEKILRSAGETRAAAATEFHRIDYVSGGGVWSMFIMGRKIQPWGFMVNDETTGAPRKIGHRVFKSKNQGRQPQDIKKANLEIHSNLFIKGIDPAEMFSGGAMIKAINQAIKGR